MNGSAYYRYWLPRNPQFVRERQGFTDKLVKINNLSGRRRGFTDESRDRGSTRIRIMHKNKVPYAE